MRRVPDPLAVAARRWPDRTALLGPEGPRTFRTLRGRVHRTVTTLRRMGLERGERVACLLPPSPRYVELLYAVLRTPAVVAPLSTRAPSSSTASLVERLDPAFLISDRNDLDADVRIVAPGDLPATGRSDETVSDRPADESNSPSRVPPTGSEGYLDLDRIATVLFTSGSTGTPKGVVHRYGSHYFSARGANARVPLTPGDRWLLSLPLYHVGGLAILFRCVLAGATAVLPPNGSPIDEVTRTRGVTHLSVVPTQLRRLVGEDDRAGSEAPEHVKVVLVGGGPTPRSLIERARGRGWPVRLTYGCTEMASQVTTSTSPVDPDGPRTAGRVLPYRRVRIGEGGEICTGGRVRFDGYLGRGELERPFRSGWFGTGDRGRWTNTEELQVLGRLDNRFVSGGENIHPEEIERALESLTAIDRAVVVPVPSPEFGARPVAYVRWKGASLPLSRVRARLEERLARYKHPDALLRWPDEVIEKGRKIDRERLAEHARRRSGSGSDPEGSGPISA